MSSSALARVSPHNCIVLCFLSSVSEKCSRKSMGFRSRLTWLLTIYIYIKKSTFALFNLLNHLPFHISKMGILIPTWQIFVLRHKRSDGWWTFSRKYRKMTMNNCHSFLSQEINSPLNFLLHWIVGIFPPSSFLAYGFVNNSPDFLPIYLSLVSFYIPWLCSPHKMLGVLWGYVPGLFSLYIDSLSNHKAPSHVYYHLYTDLFFLCLDISSEL